MGLGFDVGGGDTEAEEDEEDEEDEEGGRGRGVEEEEEGVGVGEYLRHVKNPNAADGDVCTLWLLRFGFGGGVWHEVALERDEEDETGVSDDAFVGCSSSRERRSSSRRTKSRSSQTLAMLWTVHSISRGCGDCIMYYT